MASKFDKLVEDLKAEEQQSQQPDTTPTDTPPEDKPEDTPPEDKPEDTPPANPNPDPNPNPNPDPNPVPPQNTQPHQMSPQEHAFRRQLGKAKQRYEAEIAARDEKLAQMQAQIDEMKKAMTPTPALKTRDQFDNDDDFIAYLAGEKVKEIMAGRDAEAAKKAADDAKARKEQEDLAAETQRQRQAWLENVDSAFKDDVTRKNAFLKRVEYCNARGLGTILNNCPVAADFLMQRPTGPIVFEKILNDRDTFSRVFNERATSPLDIYYELRAVEAEILAQQAQQPTQTPPQPAAPKGGVPVHIGRPGRQAAGNAAPDIFSDPRAMREFLRS